MSPKLRRRIAIILMALLFALPLLHFNIDLIERTYNLYGRARPTAPGVISIITFAVTLFFVLNLVGCILGARLAVVLKERWLGEVRFQLQLRTGMILTVVAAAFLFLNTRVETTSLFFKFGYPQTIYLLKESSVWRTLLKREFADNLFVALATLLSTALICENGLWQRVAIPSQVFPNPQPPPHNLPLTQRERWFYSIPMFLFFIVVTASSLPTFEALGIALQYRMEYSILLRVLYELFSMNSMLWIALMYAIAFVYFKWVCNSRRAVFFFNFTLYVLLFLFLLSVALGIISVFFKTQSPLRKK